MPEPTLAGRLEGIVNVYTKKRKKLKKEYNPKKGSHFNYVTGELLRIMNNTFLLLGAGAPWERMQNDWNSSIRALDTYFSLIERYPDFRQVETSHIIIISPRKTKPKPYFPNAPTEPRAYVGYAKEGLSGGD